MSSVSKEQGEGKPWYKEFWGWFVFAPLIFIACVCSVLLTVAYSLKDDVVTDDYYKKGRMINNTFAASRAASEMGLTALVNVDETGHQISVTLNAIEPVFAPVVQLVFSHPMESGLDQHFQLMREAGNAQSSVYNVVSDKPVSGRRYVQLSYFVDAPKAMRTASDPDPKIEAWRLVGELTIESNTSVTLTP